MPGKLLSKKDAERLERMLRHFERHKNDKPPLPRRPLIISDERVNIKIFEVQSAATGDGIYNCYEQKLDATEWTGTGGNDKFINAEETPTEVEVFNLEESDVVTADPDYTPALALYDLIEAYQITDNEGNNRWVGKPMVTTPRRARTTEAVSANPNINCNLILRNGVEAASDELGYNIEIYADICNEGTALNAAAVRLFNDDYVWVVNRRGKWYFAYNFENDIECICNT